MDQEPADRSLRERAHANHLELFRTMARLRPEGAVHEEDGLLLARSGPSLPFLNSAQILAGGEPVEALLARARAFFAANNGRFGLTTRGEITDRLRPALLAAGLAPLHHSPGMLLAPLAGEPPLISGLVIEPVEDLPALRVYNDTMTAGFGGEAWAREAAIADGSLLGVPDLTHYLAWLDGAPVATAMRFSSHRIAGVANVSTLPAYRNRGIGAAITWRAALDGRAEGCLASALHASEMGEPVYTRMGYRAFATYTVWLPETPVEAE